MRDCVAPFLDDAPAAVREAAALTASVMLAAAEQEAWDGGGPQDREEQDGVPPGGNRRRRRSDARNWRSGRSRRKQARGEEGSIRQVRIRKETGGEETGFEKACRKEEEITSERFLSVAVRS